MSDVETALRAERDEWMAMANDLQDDVNSLHNIHDRNTTAYNELKLEVQDLKMKLIKEQARKHAAVAAFGKAGKFCIADDDDTVTEKKARDLIDKGHDVVGYVLSQTSRTAADKLAFVVGARVEWFERHDWFDKMRQRGDDAHKIIDLENALEKERKIACEYSNLYNMECHVNKHVAALERKLAAMTEERDKERRAKEDWTEQADKQARKVRELENALADFDKKANAKMKEITYHLDETHKETIKDILKASKQQDDALKARIKELEDELAEERFGDDTGFLKGIGTVRACLDCGCLVAGGPTRCVRCAKDSVREINEAIIGAVNKKDGGGGLSLLCPEITTAIKQHASEGGLKHD